MDLISRRLNRTLDAAQLAVAHWDDWTANGKKEPGPFLVRDTFNVALEALTALVTLGVNFDPKDDPDGLAFARQILGSLESLQRAKRVAKKTEVADDA